MSEKDEALTCLFCSISRRITGTEGQVRRRNILWVHLQVETHKKRIEGWVFRGWEGQVRPLDSQERGNFISIRCRTPPVCLTNAPGCLNGLSIPF